jgi:hypothetical protein
MDGGQLWVIFGIFLMVLAFLLRGFGHVTAEGWA